MKIIKILVKYPIFKQPVTTRSNPHSDLIRKEFLGFSFQTRYDKAFRKLSEDGAIQIVLINLICKVLL